MTTPATQNEVEKLDMLLTKLDAVRYALPEVVELLMAPSSGAHAGNPQSKAQDFRHRVRNAERSFLDLQRTSSSLAGTLTDSTSQAEHLKLDLNKLQRLRKNPFSGVIYDPKRNNGQLHKLSFPLDGSEDPIISVDELNAKLEALVAKHPSVSVRQNCEKWNKRSILLQLEDLAVFHVFLTWQSESVVTFGRINVTGVKEEKQSYQMSDMILWQSLGIHASQAMSRHGRKDSLDLPCLISIISAYSSLQEQPCQSCHRLLHRQSLQLPFTRVYQASDKPKSEGEWIAYHMECYAIS